MEVFRVFATLGFNADEFTTGLSNAEKRLDGIERDFTGAGRTLTAGLTAPIVGVGAAALASSITFESAFAGVRKTVDATEEEFATLEQGIRAMSQRMPVSAEQIATVAEAAGQLGVEASNVLEFTEVMIGLGEATADMMPEEAAMQVARFMNIMQTAPEDVDRLASTVVALGNNVAATEGEITEMGLRLAGAGALIGLTDAEVLGLSATMASLGIRAEAGGTAMSRVMRTIMNAVMAGGEELDTFAGIAGVSADKFAEAYSTNPIEAIQLFSDGLGRIRDEGGNVNTALEAVSLNDIRVSDALLRMSGAGDVLSSSISMATDAWVENTALQEEVARRYETTESQMQMFWNTMKEVARTLGDALVPMLRQVIDLAKPFIAWLQSAVEWFSNLDPRMQGFIVAAAGIVAAIGPVLLIVGTFAGAISNLLPLLGLMPGAIGAIGTAFTVLTGPVGLIIAAVGALVAVFATDFLGIRTAVVNAWGAIVDAFDRAWDAIARALSGIRSSFTDWWNSTREFFRDLPGRMLDFGRDIVTGLADGIRNSITNAVEAVTGLGSRLLDNFKGLLGIASPSKVFHQFGVDIGEGLAQGMEASEQRVAGAAQRLGGIVADAAAASMSGAFTAENIISGIVGNLEGRDAMRAIQERLEVLQDARNVSFARSRIGAWGAVRDTFDNQISALQEELRRLSVSLRETAQQNTRSQEVQTARFSRAVSEFDSGVRGFTLARQRY